MTTPYWGPDEGISTLDFQLLMSYTDPTKYPYELDSHTLDTPTQNLTDTVTFSRTKKVRGRMKVVTTVSRSAEETSLDIPLGFPAGVLWSPALKLAKRGRCQRDFFLRYLCGADCHDNFFVLPNARLDAPAVATALITVNDTVVIGWTTTLHAEEMLQYFHLDSYRKLEQAGWTFLTVAPVPEECQDCDLCIKRRLIGGSNGAIPAILRTADNGANWTDVTANLTAAGATALYFVSDIAADGDYVVVGLRDNADPTAATLGQAFYSSDGGVTYTQFAGYTEGVNKVIFFNERPYLIGTNGSVYYSPDNVSLVEVQNNISTVTLTDASVDAGEGVMYISGMLSGGIGTLFVYDGTALSDISTSANQLVDLLSVHVYDRNFLAVGGTGGTYAESVDGATTWRTVTLSGSAADVNDIEGDRYRHVVAAGSVLYERSIMTEMRFTARTPRYNVTPTGDIEDIEYGIDQDEYMFVSAGPDGMYFTHTPCHPQMCE